MSKLVRKMRGSNDRVDIFSAVTEDKQFLNANWMQRRPDKSRTTCTTVEHFCPFFVGYLGAYVSAITASEYQVLP